MKSWMRCIALQQRIRELWKTYSADFKAFNYLLFFSLLLIAIFVISGHWKTKSSRLKSRELK